MRPIRPAHLIPCLVACLAAACGGGASERAGSGSPAAGAWVDEIVFREEGELAKAVEMIEAGEVHAYASGTNDPAVFEKIQGSPSIEYDVSYGLNYDLIVNPVGPLFKDGTLNPFAVPRIREAMNRLIDREYIAKEILRGLAVPKFFPLSTAFPDYARLAATARRLELEYAHDPEAAEATISREMERLGARRVEGVWRYRGKPVRLKFLIRSDDRRKEIGDYIATLLEDVGFVVERQYKTATEASPIWIGGDPAEGRWHLYTGGWISPSIQRDEGGAFFQMYTPRGRPEPLWQAYRPTPEFDRVAERLGTNDYATWEERTDLMRKALRLSLENASHVWLVDVQNVWPRRKELATTSDLASGITGSDLYPYTIRFRDRAGGRVHFASPSVLTEPWNPVAGTNWVFDKAIIRTTLDFATVPDPFTGLYHPQRIASAEVEVLEGLPVRKTLDWVELKFVPEIRVPPDAWYEWNVKEQRYDTVGARFPGGLTARVRVTLRFDTDLWERRWHDGSKFALADFLAAGVLGAERAKPESPNYDEATVAEYELGMKYARGFRILSEDPLVVESYSDRIFADAEQLAALSGFWPNPSSALYEASVPWHALAVGILAERSGSAAFSSDKADRNKVEWMNYVAGPTLAALDRALARAREENFVPYPKFLGRYVGETEARARYERLAAWRKERGHFWVGNGPFYLHEVRPVEKVVVVRKFDGYADPPEKWLRFTEPRIPQLTVEGPREVARGETAAFTATVTFRGAAYPAEDLDAVRYLLFDADGTLAAAGRAAPAGEGAFRIDLAPETTAALPAGSNRLEVIAVSKVVGIPAFRSKSFVTLPG